MTSCTRCEGIGYLNLDFSHTDTGETMHSLLCARDDGDPAHALELIEEYELEIKICDCCGNGDYWYGTPGQHYGLDDPPGNVGPYSYNGGLCECH